MTYRYENVTELYAFETEYTEELENISDANNSSPVVPTLEEWCKIQVLQPSLTLH